MENCGEMLKPFCGSGDVNDVLEARQGDRPADSFNSCDSEMGKKIGTFHEACDLVRDGFRCAAVNEHGTARDVVDPIPAGQAA